MFWLNQAHASTFAPPQGTEIAVMFDQLYTFLVWASLISSVLVIGGFIYFALKYKRRSENDKTAYISHDTRLEFLWSFIPFVIFMVCFAWGAYLYHELRNAPEDAFEIHVVGKKWNWDFIYKSGKYITGQKNEFVVPLNTPVKLIMTSDDVLHSFFIPAFRVKQDVVPGRYTSLWFEATKTGTFQVFCTEFCGKDHSAMLSQVKVVPRADFEQWLQEDPDAEYKGIPLVEAGQKVYSQICIACHQTTDVSAIGPGFKGLYGKSRSFTNTSVTVEADENYLRESILNPNAKIVQGMNGQGKPYLKGQMPMQKLTELQLSGVIEFIKSLK